VARKVDGDPTKIQGTVERFPWTLVEQELALHTATNQHHHTEGTSVEILN